MKDFKKLLILFFSIGLAFSCTVDNPDNSNGKSANLKSLGASAEDLLTASKFTSMKIEMVYVEGNRPTDQAINLFKEFLMKRTHKPDGINFLLRSVPSSGKAPFAIEEIAEIERQERTAYNVGDEIAIWIYFADGSNEEDTNEKIVLGSAFRNTSMVIYEKTIREFANRNDAPSKEVIEASTLNHEFGHLFGLVDLGIEPVSEHEYVNEEGKGGHCTTSRCLMNAEIEFGRGVADVIEGNNGVPELDQACIDDLQSVGGK